MYDSVGRITIRAFLGIYPPIREVAGVDMPINEDAIKYWDTYREMAIKHATKAIGQLLDAIKAEIDKQTTMPHSDDGVEE